MDVWQGLLSVRSLVLPMHEDVDVWLKFAALCRKDNRPRLAVRTLTQLLSYDPQTIPKGEPGYGAQSNTPQVMMGYLKHMWWAARDPVAKADVCARLLDLTKELDENPDLAQICSNMNSFQNQDGLAHDRIRQSSVSMHEVNRTSVISILTSEHGTTFIPIPANQKHHPLLIAKAYKIGRAHV